MLAMHEGCVVNKSCCFPVHGQRCPVNPGWVALSGGGVRSLAPPPEEFSIPDKAWWASGVHQESASSQSGDDCRPFVVHQENEFKRGSSIQHL